MSQTLSYRSKIMEMGYIGEQDTIRGNSIEISLYLLFYFFGQSLV